MARGNRKSTIFEDDKDRTAFLELVGETVRRYKVRAYGDCLMGNHYHMVVETPRGNLSDAMRFLNGVYAQVSNRRHGRTGHLFEARYRSLVIQREGYLRRALRYVVLNPVRARLVSTAAAWPWSSYRATAGLEPAPDWLNLDWLEWAFDAEPGTDFQDKYRRYVNDPTARRSVIDTTAIAVGGRGFRERLARANGRRVPDRPLPAGYQAAARPPLDELLPAAYRDGHALARAAHTAHVTHGYRQSDIARHVKRDPSTISKLLRELRSGDGRPST
jgi:REP element-mobilizing transposase RayT